MTDNTTIVRQFIEEVLNRGDIIEAGRYIWADDR